MEMEDTMSGLLRHHLTCPISLQPMQDPVTSPTGITYDRRAIERWLAAGHATCPVTGQPLALADLTPNLTLRRLIHSWRPPRSTSSTPVPVPEAAAADDEAVIKKLMLCTSTAADSASSSPPPPVVDVLREAATVASGSDAARRRMVDAGVLHRVLRLLTVKCAAAADQETETMLSGGVEAGLDLVRALALSSGDDEMLLVADTHVHDVLDAVTDVLVSLERTTPAGTGDTARASAVRLLDTVMDAAEAGSAATAVLERLRPALFRAVTGVVRARISPGATRSALRVLLHACPLPRNRALLADAGAAHEAIELLLDAPSPSATTELCMALLAELCGCAEGRAAVAAHAAGVAVVARRIRLLRASAAADACGVRVLAAVAGRAASGELLREMARVGAVGKLCCVLQADCDADVRDAARGVLRMHAGVWSASPCVSAYLLSRYL